MDRTIFLTVLDYTVRIVVLVIGYIIAEFIRKNNLEKWIRIGINTAEQIYKDSGKGPEKKEYARKMVKEKFRINDDELDKLIDGAVAELNNTIWKK